MSDEDHRNQAIGAHSSFHSMSPALIACDTWLCRVADAHAEADSVPQASHLSIGAAVGIAVCLHDSFAFVHDDLKDLLSRLKESAL